MMTEIRTILDIGSFHQGLLKLHYLSKWVIWSVKRLREVLQSKGIKYRPRKIF